MTEPLLPAFVLLAGFAALLLFLAFAGFVLAGQALLSRTRRNAYRGDVLPPPRPECDRFWDARDR